MRTVPMGTTGLTVPVQGFGCMRLAARSAHDSGGRSDPEAVIHRALDLGATFLDTADMYGKGANEELVGRALRHRRDDAVLCTKFGVVRGTGDEWSLRGDAAYVRVACEASLRRLGTDFIDLYYLHQPDPAVPVEESVGAMAELVTAGKVRHLGLSNVTGEELRAAHAVHPIAAVQSEWSLCGRRIEEMVPVAAELGVGVVPYCPHGAGLLSGDADTARKRLAEAAPGYEELPGRLRALARRRGVRPGQVALAWVQHRADVWGVAVSPIPGTTRVSHLEENIAAADLRLDGEELALLDVGPAHAGWTAEGNS
ncbi:aldo/keto reductase [Streptomyces sp. NPDC017993]|uniref:aldo/keto reductase n=1 Tax=Streptomyces sp. NPDC017993 TaxID=3365027 RepID=UPI0037BAA8B5